MSAQESPLPLSHRAIAEILDSQQRPLMYQSRSYDAFRDFGTRFPSLRDKDHVARDYGFRGEHLKAIEEYSRLIRDTRRGIGGLQASIGPGVNLMPL